MVTVDAIGCKSFDGTMLSGDHTQDAIPPIENAYSVGLTIQFGSFKYATLGDLGGYSIHNIWHFTLI